MNTRRHFLQSIGAALLAVFSWPASKAFAAKVAFGLEKVPKLGAVGGSAVLKLKGKEILLVRESEDSVRAIDAICSHEQCTVGFNIEVGRIECPCHGSRFDLDGKVLKGPAETDLSVYSAQLDGDRIIVTLDDGP